jgi:hypothetical protein
MVKKNSSKGSNPKIKIFTIKHIMPKNIKISTKYYILLRKANRINIDWKIENDGPVIIFHKTHIMISP